MDGAGILMARTYANVDAGIWDDADFCALSAGAQRTYFMLITQREITACGTLALTLRRWGKTCGEKDLEVWLAELSDAAFVLIDEDSEELLVRTFVKWDGGHKHATRRKAVISFARAIRSPLLRDAAAAELAKLGVSIATEVAMNSHRSGTEQGPESYGSVVKQGELESTPHSTFQEREPAPSESDVADPPSMFCSKHPNGTEKPCGPCGTAKLKYAAWLKSGTARAAAARKARENCPRCLGDVWLPDGTKCDHRILEETTR